MTSRTVAQAVGLVLTGMFISVGAAHAADTPSAPTAPRAVSAGVQVAIDPVTHQLRAPTDAERAAYAKAFQERQSRISAFATQPRTRADATKTLRTVDFGNGMRGKAVKLPQEMMSSVVATRNADGTISIHHDGDDSAAKAPEATR
ncbi:hypothetical protein P3W24_17275 [Luteibacter sp. PPL201]|jgi:hypothetical protein|uniref:DUF4148 domain-containing protein n=1 Tax=Luteibacter sahnii TaxID=3021977 RepID=A0ABT6BFF5_9GAMM|nr:hypothetical protein [Luteibacter sp. PPL193]MDY1549589.1 hypothetical protein [Luteibacter sp. PPL193]